MQQIENDLVSEHRTEDLNNKRVGIVETLEQQEAEREKHDTKLVEDLISNQTVEILRDQEYIYKYEDTVARVCIAFCIYSPFLKSAVL
jgi:hypothetical protein